MKIEHIAILGLMIAMNLFLYYYAKRNGRSQTVVPIAGAIFFGLVLVALNSDTSMTVPVWGLFFLLCLRNSLTPNPGKPTDEKEVSDLPGGDENIPE